MPLSKIPSTAMRRALHELLFPTIYYDPEAELYTLRPIVFSPNVWADKTACEAFVNHIHLQDYIFCDNTTAYRKTAFAVAESWVSRLREIYPGKQFVLYLTTENTKWNQKSNPILRFCLVRADEAPYISEASNGKTLWKWETWGGIQNRD